MHTILTKVVVLVLTIWHSDSTHEVQTTEGWIFMDCIQAAAAINAMERIHYPDPDKITAMKAGCFEFNAFVPGDNA